MALNTKDPDMDALARELSALPGESITEAIRVALGERMARLRWQRTVSQRNAELQRFIDRGRQRATHGRSCA